MEIKKNEAIAANRLMYFHLVKVTDGMTPEDDAEDEQPQISVNGADGIDTTNKLVKIVDMPGDYYVQLEQGEVDLNLRDIIQGTFKNANTAQMTAVIIQIIDPTAANLSIWAVLTSALTNAGSIGKLLVDMLNAAIGTRSTPGDLTREFSPGVQLRRQVQTGTPMEIYSGDTKTFDINLGSEWDLTGKKAWLCVKEDLAVNDASAIINREYTVTDAPNAVGEITTTSDETKKPGTYIAEVKVTDADGMNPETARRHELKIIKSVKTGA
jgi:hypothetical protein